jgi:hypothetical protein
MSDDLEKELAATPAVDPITRDQRRFIEDLLDQLEITLDEAMRDCYVNGDFSSDPDSIDRVEDLSKAEASVLIDYLLELRNDR